MNTVLRYLGQAVAYGLFIAFIGFFSTSPAYTHVPPGHALIKFTFTQPGKRLAACVERSREELAKLPPQLRKPTKCPRERSPISVVLEMDGETVYQAQIKAKGLAQDLPSPVYERFIVPAGEHTFRVRMRDDVKTTEGYNHFGEKTMVLAPLQTVVIDFDKARSEFTFE